MRTLSYIYVNNCSNLYEIMMQVTYSARERRSSIKTNIFYIETETFSDVRFDKIKLPLTSTRLTVWGVFFTAERYA